MNKRKYILTLEGFKASKLNEDSKENHLKSLKANSKFNLIDRDYNKIDNWKWGQRRHISVHIK